MTRLWIAACCLSFGALGAAVAVPRPAFGDGRNDANVVELGRRLFFDPAISRSGTNACSSCHDPDHGWSSREAHDDDDFTPNPRHAHTLVDASLRTGVLHWDGEYAQVEQLVVVRLGVPSASVPRYQHGAMRLPGYNDVDRPVAVRPLPPPPAPVPPPATTPGSGAGAAAPAPAAEPTLPPLPTLGPVEPPPPKGWYESTQQGYGVDPLMGVTPPHVVAFHDDLGRRRFLDLQQMMPLPDRIERDGRYADAFEAAFGSKSVTISRLATAIAEFVRTIRSGESPYDRFVAGDAQAISRSARRGFALFRDSAGCARCHLLGGEDRRAAFTDRRFHVTGIVARSYGGKKGIDSDEQVRDLLDVGRARLSTAPDERRAFRTPTLRDVARRGPWMHDGSMTSLEDVVRHYAGGAVPDPHLDPLLEKGFDAGRTDVEDLTAFLRTLSSDVRPGIAPECAMRAKSTRVRVLDEAGRPMPGLRIRAVPAGDRLPGDVEKLDGGRDLVTDAAGELEFEPGRRTHTRLVPAGGLRAPQGEMVPDTCRRFDLVLPVAGRATLTVVGIPPEDALDALTVTIPPLDAESLRAPGGFDTHIPLPPALALNPRKVTFARARTAAVGTATVVGYEAWVPVKAPSKAVVTFLSGSSRVIRVVSLVPGDDTRVDLRDP